MTSVNDVPLKTSLQQRLARVEERIGAACVRAGRLRSDVTLLAVTKTVSVEAAALLPELGVVDLGENRPQELWRKAALLPATVRWHLVGHLQRNKIERTLPLICLLHSADSLRLLAALDEEGAKQGRLVNVLLEVNASREGSKHGFTPEEIPGMASQIAALEHVCVRGMMTMAAFDEDPERCRPTFALTRRLRDRLGKALPEPHRLDHLSMGMSNDFEVAIEEGATLVRIGTALFANIVESDE
jgi:pyridoxal phosphate enzyme (YggS family)